MLTNKGQPFVWTESQESAFRALKDCLITAPILASPHDEGEFVLDTDASMTGLGAVLQQHQGEKLKVIAYASRVLSRIERNYSTTRRELLAVIFGLKQFRQILLGRHFILRVDHLALTYLRRTPEPMGQAARWLEYIEEYDFTMIHRPGSAHGNCDALSRRPPDREEDGGLDGLFSECRRLRKQYAAEVETDIELTPAVISEAQLSDPALTPLISVLKVLGPRPAWSEMQSASEETRALWAQFESLKFCENLLYREFYRPDGTVSRMQTVLPRSLRQFF